MTRLDGKLAGELDEAKTGIEIRLVFLHNLFQSLNMSVNIVWAKSRSFILYFFFGLNKDLWMLERQEDSSNSYAKNDEEIGKTEKIYQLSFDKRES